MSDAPDDADDNLIETNKAKQRYAAFLSRMKGEEERKVYNELVRSRKIETEKEEQRRDAHRLRQKKEKEEQRTEEEEEDMARQRYAAMRLFCRA